jgi:hypothetical protein
MLKMRVSGCYSQLTLCNFVFKRPTQAPRTLMVAITAVEVKSEHHRGTSEHF